jgi:predicted ABC-type ATPase
MIDKPLVDPAFLAAMRGRYAPAERNWLDMDKRYIVESLFHGKQPVAHGEPKIYLATAGGPGAGKTTILEQYLAAAKEASYRSMVVSDPDQPILRMMGNLNVRHMQSLARVADAGSTGAANKAAYDFCRDGSNYIAYAVLNKAVAGGYNIAHGTTSTGDKVPDNVSLLKAQGYQVHYLLVAAPDKVRTQNVQHRVTAQANYQSTPEDVKDKGGRFWEMLPFYFKQADKVDLYFSAKPLQQNHVATVVGNAVTVHDAKGLSGFVREYEKVREASAANGKPLPALAEVSPALAQAAVPVRRSLKRKPPQATL